jgi:hypothetical protein
MSIREVEAMAHRREIEMEPSMVLDTPEQSLNSQLMVLRNNTTRLAREKREQRFLPVFHGV